MLSRALILATVAFAWGCLGIFPADAQNLEAGKPPSQIFSSTCSLCHKSARGLLKSVGPGSLPGFLRQHYTTSSDMAAAMSAYVLSNGAANAAPGGGNLTKQGQEAKTGRAPEHSGEASAEAQTERQKAAAERKKAAAERRAARLAAKGKAGKEEPPPKNEARHEPAKDEPAKSDAPAGQAAKTDAPKVESPKAETSKTEPRKAEAASTQPPKAEGTRPDPVPAVTPAPKESETAPKEAEKPASVATALPKAEVPSGPLTIDMGPPPEPKTPATPVGPPPVPAGKPEPPISR